MTHSHVTPCGLPGVGSIPVGMHSCHFYSDRQQLIDALVPYILAGLQAKERCLIIASPPLPARDLVRELRQGWDGVEEALHAGALRVIDFDRWYLGTTGLKSEDLVQLWLQEEERALAEGYSGLRVSGNISFLRPEQWPAFMAYEKSVSANFSKRRIVALCSYVLEDCTGDRKDQVLSAHRCAFERRDHDWHVVMTGTSF
ncbi:MAG TPA: MEDS domain-containing protein [Rhizomicrobium sp.]|nr:MEDS domain-containing protein [Rhizomicrobium sp.]